MPVTRIAFLILVTSRYAMVTFIHRRSLEIMKIIVIYIHLQDLIILLLDPLVLPERMGRMERMERMVQQDLLVITVQLVQSVLVEGTV